MIREGLLQHSSLCIICVKLLHFEALLTRYNITWIFDKETWIASGISFQSLRCNSRVQSYQYTLLEHFLDSFVRPGILKPADKMCWKMKLSSKRDFRNWNLHFLEKVTLLEHAEEHFLDNWYVIYIESWSRW